MMDKIKIEFEDINERVAPFLNNFHSDNFINFENKSIVDTEPGNENLQTYLNIFKLINNLGTNSIPKFEKKIEILPINLTFFDFLKNDDSNSILDISYEDIILRNPSNSEPQEEKKGEKRQRKINFENIINYQRESYLKEKITPLLIDSIKEEEFEFGFRSKSELIVEEHLNINALATRNWLNELFVNNIHNQKILEGLLIIIGRMKFEQINPQGFTIASAALNFKNPVIQELAVRAFENWNSKNSIDLLKALDIKKKWLREYIKQVIIDLEEHGISSTKD